MIAKAATGAFIRYSIREDWPNRRPRLVEEQWELTPKQARLRLGEGSYSIHTPATFERSAVTPEAALDAYIEVTRRAVEAAERALEGARERLDVATSLVIADGKLAL